MTDTFSEIRDLKNACQFNPQSTKGHYESYFLRANHPTKPLAFWIRYTIFSSKGKKHRSIGELWGAFFDGEKDQVFAIKSEVPIAQCYFSKNTMAVEIGKAKLSAGCLEGIIKQENKSYHWKLTYDANKKPLAFLPEAYYKAPLPKAKSFIGNPNTLFNGELTIESGDKPVKYNISNWQGSENHNWGSKHTDEYAWGQVSGFDNDKDAFLECITARIKIGPVYTPKLTLVCLRVNNQEYNFNTVIQSVKAKGSYHYFDWKFKSKQNGITISGRINAPKKHFVGLNYYNPPGGSNTCLNSKIASCEIIIKEQGKADIKLITKHRAAFEVLTSDSNHNVSIDA